MRWQIEFTEEVRTWYIAQSPKGRAITDRVLERLASRGNSLRMPHSRALGGGLHELRFTVDNTQRRIAYIFDPDRRVIMLTTFRKQKQNERSEILRARRAAAARSTTRPSKGGGQK